ncbi:SLC13 family permease [Clostridium sardiniense]|uniref:SLC13 family permease n=1 Tax=Clostridium sardiniense TaxID=29369 RepID=UPI001959D53E|nr:SLC13 family permease [Clostridium sardiniense]MBM7836745.1 Na+/H+ antiporter NhaD/arsenite permease-like protein [Clostridium sardiniense]
MAIILIIVIAIYIAMIFSVKYRTAIATLGIGALLLYTTIFEGYSFADAFKSFPFEIIVLILTLALFSKIFENNGFLKFIGDKLSELSKGKKLFIMIVLPLVMYATSLFMNNLSVVLLFTFISLTLIRKLDLPVIPVLVSGLIASNIGGCPLPWADTPAVIITLYTDFTIIDFLTKVFVPCAIYVVLLIIYTIIWTKFSNKNSEVCCDSNSRGFLHYHKPKKFPRPPHAKIGIAIPPPPPPYEPAPHIKIQMKDSRFKNVYLPLILFAGLITGICIAPFFNISISYICIFFMGLTIIFVATNPEEILNSLSVNDSIIFISSLFMISGILEHFGILKIVVTYILSFTGDSKILILLCILFSAFIISTFLSAGPATATILPICVQLLPVVGSNFIFAALALGILAGSSMLPWSATGGPIMLSEVDRYLHHYNISNEEEVKIKEVYNLKNYILFSIPFALLMLICSALYLVIYISI